MPDPVPEAPLEAQPACWYHGEDEQEDFLVLAGEVPSDDSWLPR